MPHKVLIIGCGNIGSWHLQSLRRLKFKLSIYVVDSDPKSFSLAKQRFNKIKNLTSHSCLFSTELPKKIKYFDICILATSSHRRYKIIESISEKVVIKNWIIEKVLSQNKNDLIKIEKLIDLKKCNAWVNTPHRTQLLFKKLKNKIKKKRVSGSVKGVNWGLMCNSIHYLDVFSWLLDEKLVSINTDKLNKQWFSSKRGNYMEVDGALKATFSEGSSLLISCKSKKNSKKKLIFNILDWSIDIVCGRVTNLKSDVGIFYKLKPQSKLTHKFVKDIILKNNCDLPSIQESIFLHKVFIDSVLPKWRDYTKKKSLNIPIT
tara:strand:+ start:7678 stop:8631 length:954 start_codon:yes stop_codon:yes gene_type:complete